MSLKDSDMKALGLKVDVAHRLTAQERLPLTPKICDGESYDHYVDRLAKINGFSGPAAFAKIFGYRPDRLDRWLLPAVLEELTGHSAKEILFRCGRARFVVDHDHGIAECFRRGRRVSTLGVNARSPRYCPHCLKEAAYIRGDWLAEYLPACTAHGVVLLDRCARCNKAPEFVPENPMLCACGNDLTSDITWQATEETIMLQRMLIACEGSRDRDRFREAARVALCSTFNYFQVSPWSVELWIQEAFHRITRERFFGTRFRRTDSADKYIADLIRTDNPVNLLFEFEKDRAIWAKYGRDVDLEVY